LAESDAERCIDSIRVLCELGSDPCKNYPVGRSDGGMDAWNMAFYGLTRRRLTN